MFGDFFYWFTVGMLSLIFIYLAARLASFAYFRTKLSFLKAIQDHRKEDHNGKV